MSGEALDSVYRRVVAHPGLDAWGLSASLHVSYARTHAYLRVLRADGRVEARPDHTNNTTKPRHRYYPVTPGATP